MIIETKEKHLYCSRNIRVRKNIYLFAYSQRTDIFMRNDKESHVKKCKCCGHFSVAFSTRWFFAGIIICTKINGKQRIIVKRAWIWRNRNREFSNWPPFSRTIRTYLCNRQFEMKQIALIKLSRVTSITDIMRVDIFFFFFEFRFD